MQPERGGIKKRILSAASASSRTQRAETLVIPPEGCRVTSSWTGITSRIRGLTRGSRATAGRASRPSAAGAAWLPFRP